MVTHSSDTSARVALYRQVAILHSENIPSGFLSSLGVPFLELLYKAIDESGESVLLVYKSDNKVVGFVAASTGMRPIYVRLLRHSPTLVFVLLPKLFSVSNLKRMLELFLHQIKGKAIVEDSTKNELLSIAVDENHRRKNIAQSLYLELCGYFRLNGINQFSIVVGDELSGAHKFYRKMGARPVSSLSVHSGQCSTVYIHTL